METSQAVRRLEELRDGVLDCVDAGEHLLAAMRALEPLASSATDPLVKRLAKQVTDRIALASKACATASQGFAGEFEQSLKPTLRSELARCLSEEHQRPDLASKLLRSMEDDPFGLNRPKTSDPQEPEREAEDANRIQNATTTRHD